MESYRFNQSGFAIFVMSFRWVLWASELLLPPTSNYF